MFTIKFSGGSLDGTEWKWPVDDIPASLKFKIMRGARQSETSETGIVLEDGMREETYINSKASSSPLSEVLIFEPSPPAKHWIPEIRDSL